MADMILGYIALSALIYVIEAGEEEGRLENQVKTIQTLLDKMNAPRQKGETPVRIQIIIFSSDGKITVFFTNDQ